jgi:hypothetical protein
MSEGHLFNKAEMYSVVQGHTNAVKKKVQAIPANTLLNASEHDVIQAVVDEFRLNVPIIKDDDLYIAHSGEAQVDVSRDPMRMIMDRGQPFHIPGTKIFIAVPFEGDAGFFDIRPQTFTMNPPRGEVVKDEIRLTYVRTDHDAESIKREYQRTLASIREYLKWLSESASQFNSQLEGLVTQQVKTRKDRLLADAGMAASIGLPMKKREGVPVTYAVPVQRRAPRIDQIKVSGAFVPEPVLANEDYEEIISIMKNMVRVMELSPHEFHEIGEEALRSHFLVQLNGAYKGQATGETFNFQGKTDILIRVDGKNVFIGECKFWKGEKAFLETVSQLLSYVSWRDTKVAVLVFNRNADFSAVLAKLREAVPKHPNFKRDACAPDESTFRYIFFQPNDANREMILTVLAFDIPTNPVDIKSIGAGQTAPTEPADKT